MKEATGELNMTVITVVAIAAVAALVYAFVWPAIEDSIRKNTICSGGNGTVVDGEKAVCTSLADGQVQCNHPDIDANEPFTCDNVANSSTP